MLDPHIRKCYTDILKDELMSATGCTEPIAIAYAASILSDALGEYPETIKADFSGNIIKNVKSVIVPMTGGKHGIEAAIAAGFIAAAPQKKLDVLTSLCDDAGDRIDRFLSECKVTVGELGSGCAFELHIKAQRGDKTAEIVIEGDHTNVTCVRLSGRDITERYCQRRTVDGSLGTVRVDRTELSVEGIVEFADTAELDELRPYLSRQIETNMAIAKEGLTGKYGASIGKLLLSYGDDIRRKAAAVMPKQIFSIFAKVRRSAYLPRKKEAGIRTAV